MCYYLQKVRHVEILKMKAEFLRDGNNNIWFSCAKDIHIRRSEPKELLPDFTPDNVELTMLKI